MAQLRDKALLIELHLKKWSGVKTDKSLRDELAIIILLMRLEFQSTKN